MRTILASALVSVGVLLAGYLLIPSPSTGTPQTISSPSTVDPVEVTPAVPLKVYKPAVKNKTALGNGLKVAKEQHLVGVATVMPSERSMEVTTVFNELTGDFTTQTIVKPSPWFSGAKRTEVYAEAGMRSSDMRFIQRVGFNHEFAKVKDVGIGITAQVDSDLDAFAGVRISYRW